MFKNVIRGMLVAALVVLPLTAVANTVFHLDSPQDGDAVFGLVEVQGWILDDGEDCGPIAEWLSCEWSEALVSSVDLYVDDVYVASADLGQPRWDVLQAYPWYAGTPYERPGFSVSFNAGNYTWGEHPLFLRVTLSDSTVWDYGHIVVNLRPTLNQAPFGELERPGENQPMNGIFPMTGWALDDSEVAKIEVLVDGLIVGPVNTRTHRPDIAHRFPAHPGAEDAGFIRMLNTTEMTNGVHTVAIRLTDNEGMVRVIGRRFVQTFNAGYNLPPIGGIDWPLPNHIMFGDGCNDPADVSTPPYEDPENVEWVAGWALDVGATTDRGGVAYVELLIDGALVLDTYEPFYFAWLEQFTELVNTYGLPRMDILSLFPDVPNAKDAGFFFALDINDLLLNQGFRQGLHMITIRAGDWENNVTDIARLPVIFDCDDDRDLPSWGQIDLPLVMERVSGDIEMKGWAIDFEHVEEVEIWIDGIFYENADQIDLPSPDVDEWYPWLSNSLTLNARWHHVLDSIDWDLTDGEHVLVIWTEDYWGGRTMIGERIFVVDNLAKKATEKATVAVALN